MTGGVPDRFKLFVDHFFTIFIPIPGMGIAHLIPR